MRGRRWWQSKRVYCEDGRRHEYVEINEPLPRHMCDDYCHHYLVRCRLCGRRVLAGTGIPEVR